MSDLNDLLKPVWGAEESIHDAWSQLTEEEKCLITGRVDEVFKNGLPFELKHDKSVYIHTFSLLAQLEMMGIQIPLKFGQTISNPIFQKQMRAQLLDEIFHGIVCIKIIYLLAAPYAFPPRYNEQVNTLCAFIQNEECPKVAIVMVNLVVESWGEELFKCLKQHDIAPELFGLILDDEERHVSEADVYREMGLPDNHMIATKLEHLEQLLFTAMFLQYNISMSLMTLLGIEGMHRFLRLMDHKHIQQLKKIKLVPGKKWTSTLQFFHNLFEKIHQNGSAYHQLEMSPHRRSLMTQWTNPTDPTMVAQFNMDVTCLDFFNKKYPSDTVTTVMLQTMSQFMMEYPQYKQFLNDNKLYQHQSSRVSLAVKLPGCKDHLGAIVFQNCHEIPVSELSIRIKASIRRMVYCYQKREQLERAHPHLLLIERALFTEFLDPVYRPLFPSTPGISLSNVGSSGYSQAVSPLFPNEAMKVTLLEIEKRLVWDNITHTFEARDILPISVSADHRIFDGQLFGPKLMSHFFQQKVQEMTLSEGNALKTACDDASIRQWMDYLLKENLEFGYTTLMALQTVWPDFLMIESFFK
jgi:hypothetical protein